MRLIHFRTAAAAARVHASVPAWFDEAREQAPQDSAFWTPDVRRA